MKKEVFVNLRLSIVRILPLVEKVQSRGLNVGWFLSLFWNCVIYMDGCNKMVFLYFAVCCEGSIYGS